MADRIENAVETVVVPEVPKVIPNEQIYVYVPIATETDKGILRATAPDFTIIDGELKLLDGEGSKLGNIKKSVVDLQNTKQDKRSNELNTVDKTVVGAINENKRATDNLSRALTETNNSLDATNRALSGTNDFVQDVNDKVITLENAGFITNAVNDLLNYYLKSELYTKEQVNQLLQNFQKAAFKIVSELPETGELNIIYLLAKTDTTEDNLYDEYIYTNGSWERIGSTSVNLDDYYTKTEVDTNIDDASKYTNTTPTPAAIGGIKKGETFDDVPVQTMLTKILYPYVAPKINSVSTVVSGGTFEKGSEQNVQRVSASITKGTEAIVKAELLYNGSVVDTKTSEDFGSGTITFECSYHLSITDSVFAVRITDNENKSYSANSNRFTFVYPYYYGVVAADTTVDEVTIKGLTKLVQGMGTKRIYYTANNQKMVFVSPYAVRKITDPNGFDVTTTFSMTRVSVTGLDGTAQSYYVYTANDASTVSEFVMTFTH